jgi:hypothetical protein
MCCSSVVHKEEKHTHSILSGPKNWNSDSVCDLFSPIFRAEMHNHTHAGGYGVFIPVTVPFRCYRRAEEYNIETKSNI